MFSTCDKVCIFRIEVVLFHEVDFAEGDEREDGDVVAHADQTNEPKAGGKHQNVSKVNLKLVQILI